MNEEKKMIRFIDSTYQVLFFLEDGENISLTYSDGTKAVRNCRYYDDYHVQVGGSVYHICEFAEIMERNKTSYAPEKEVALPEMCYEILPSDGHLVRIWKGEDRYDDLGEPSREFGRGTEASWMNEKKFVTRQQSAAMLGGILHGWESAAAKVSSYDFYGQPVGCLAEA